MNFARHGRKLLYPAFVLGILVLFVVVGVANPFFVQSPPSGVFLAWSVCWVVLIVSLTVWSLHRREV